LVSPQAGTTRDYLEATIQHLGIEMAWVDTAGIESLSSDRSPRAAAQLQTTAQLADAHLILLCHPADSPPESLPALPESLRPSTDIQGHRRSIGYLGHQRQDRPRDPGSSGCRRSLDPPTTRGNSRNDPRHRRALPTGTPACQRIGRNGAAVES
jgi:hypothetical protein